MGSKTTTKNPIKMDYPLDKSSKGTPANTPETMKGSTDSLSHSIEGTKAHQGRSKGGRMDRFN